MFRRNTTTFLLIAGGIIFPQFSVPAFGQPVNITGQSNPVPSESSAAPGRPVITVPPDGAFQPERSDEVRQSGQSRPAAPEKGEVQLTGDSPIVDPPKKETSVPEEGELVDPLIARGRYLSTVGGCNDCHTTGFASAGGSIPEKDWFLGNAVGFRGPWGTTYSANLRYYLNGFTEDQWLVVARKLKSRPPMPSYSLNQMEEDDLRAVYRFVKSLGDKGQPGPSYVPPGTEPKTQYIVFEPVGPKKLR